MEIPIQIRKNTTVEVPIEDIIEEINLMPPLERMKQISSLINGINDDDIKELTQEQIIVILKWLDRQTKRFAR